MLPVNAAFELLYFSLLIAITWLWHYHFSINNKNTLRIVKTQLRAHFFGTDPKRFNVCFHNNLCTIFFSFSFDLFFFLGENPFKLMIYIIMSIIINIYVCVWARQYNMLLVFFCLIFFNKTKWTWTGNLLNLQTRINGNEEKQGK